MVPSTMVPSTTVLLFPPSTTASITVPHSLLIPLALSAACTVLPLSVALLAAAVCTVLLLSLVALLAAAVCTVLLLSLVASSVDVLAAFTVPPLPALALLEVFTDVRFYK